MEKASLEDLKILIFLAFYYLILNFYQAKVNTENWSKNVKAVIFVIVLKQLVLFLVMPWHGS